MDPVTVGTAYTLLGIAALVLGLSCWSIIDTIRHPATEYILGRSPFEQDLDGILQPGFATILAALMAALAFNMLKHPGQTPFFF